MHMVKLRGGPLDGQTVKILNPLLGDMVEFKGELDVLGKKTPVVIKYRYRRSEGVVVEGIFFRIDPVSSEPMGF